VGVYRWSRILTRREEIASFRADRVEGADWYQRAMRAHANCVENLPVYGAIVVALLATGVASPWIDRLAVLLLAARVAQTSVHIALPQTNRVVAVRFSFFLTQALCMLAISGILLSKL
jgi:uncharacterized MAPEG superfamily protein